MERRGREIRLHGSEGGGAQQWAVENSRKSRDVAPLHFCCARENAQKMAAWRGATEVEGLKTGPTEALFNSPGVGGGWTARAAAPRRANVGPRGGYVQPPRQSR